MHNPYFNYRTPDVFLVNTDTNNTKSLPLETYLPDDYIKYANALNRSLGFPGKV